MTLYTVFTGDIIASTALPPRALDLILADIATLYPTGPTAHFARRGGDAWQMAFQAPHTALRTALLIQAHVMSHGPNTATRIAIAIGKGTVPDNGDLNAAHGDAFTQSGRGLEAMRTPSRINDTRGGAHHASAILADHIAQGWTQTQARAIAAALSPDAPTQATIATTLGVTRQSVNQTLRAAGYSALSTALSAIEAAA